MELLEKQIIDQTPEMCKEETGNGIMLSKSYFRFKDHVKRNEKLLSGFLDNMVNFFQDSYKEGYMDLTKVHFQMKWRCWYCLFKNRGKAVKCSLC